MFERNADIARNTLEMVQRQVKLLQRHHQAVLNQIAAGEAQLAALKRRHARDTRLAFALAFSLSLAIVLSLGFTYGPRARLFWFGTW